MSKRIPRSTHQIIERFPAGENTYLNSVQAFSEGHNHVVTASFRAIGNNFRGIKSIVVLDATANAIVGGAPARQIRMQVSQK